MSELKRTFTGGKMNKDLDERFVPKNQYRHAINVQVRESDSDAAGTVQNLLGNVAIGSSYFAEWMGDIYTDYNGQISGAWIEQEHASVSKQHQVCVASIADEKNDNAYFFFTDVNKPLDHIFEYKTCRMFIDNIVEQNVNGATSRVFNDHWATTGRLMDVLPLNGMPATNDTYATNGNGVINDSELEAGWNELRVRDGRKFRVGMIMRGYANQDFTNDKLLVDGNNPRIKAIKGNLLIFDEPVDVALTANNITHVAFVHKRALNFQHQLRNHITGINIIDDLLFWTDNYSEPKKINITRCKAGTYQNRHTQLFVEDISNNNNLINVASITPKIEAHNAYYNTINERWFINADMQESHLTVLRKAPKMAPTLQMSDSERESMGGLVDVSVTNYSFVTAEGEVSEIELNVGDIRTIIGPEIASSRFRKDDILTITQADANVLLETFITIKAKFICYEDVDGNEVFSGPTDRMRVSILAIDGAIVTSENLNWQIVLDEREPLFKTTFCRFGCRYKYEDGEYSSFGPWSKIAFLPGKFDYSAKNGYNLGMANNVRELIIRDFIPYNIPIDVVEVDILYKATNNANVYIAQTITKNKSPEWDMFTPNIGSLTIQTGELYITSEMIHRVLPEMQTFRSWDNVPTRALAQEIVGNRLVYGNYYQGYNMENPIMLSQTISSESTNLLSVGYPSIKSLRNYKVGMVFGDKYGRETPVFTSGYVTSIGNQNEIAISGDLYTDKSLSSTKNKFVLSQSWADPNTPGVSVPPPRWLHDGGYIKYFIKETSNEYYNLVLDRWYDSGDDTIWLSFNSADRNKVDEETHLILKNQHSSNQPVFDDVRYKILAIKNEAPDYIRTRYINLGEVVGLLPDNTVSMWNESASDEYETPSLLFSSEGVPQSGQDGFSFMIEEGFWNDNSVGFTQDDLQGIFGRDIQGSLEIQFVGRRIFNGVEPDGTLTPLSVNYTLESEWRKISNYNKDLGDGTEPNYIRFVWTKAYKGYLQGGVDFPSMYEALFGTNDFGGGTLMTIQWGVRFREAIKENRPEFDGKFFVKINNDESLVSNVINLSYGAGAIWVPESEYQLSYIDSQYVNPAVGDMGSELATVAQDTISKYANWGPETSNVGFWGHFDGLTGPYSDWSPRVDFLGETWPDPYFFDAPYWSGGLGSSEQNSNLPMYEYEGYYGVGLEEIVGLLDQQFYGWAEGLDYNTAGNGVTPYMPFVPLEYTPNVTSDSTLLSSIEFTNPSDSIWNWPTFIDWSPYSTADPETGELVGLQFVPGAGGPMNGEQGQPRTNEYGAGLFGGTCGPAFEWYYWNEATKSYWQDYAVNFAPGGEQENNGNASGGTVFMDGAGARRYITTVENPDYWPGEQVTDQSGNILPGVYYYEYYKPKAIERGIELNPGVGNGSGTPENHLGRMNLGITYYNYKQNTAVNNASVFFDKMTTVGTVFRFSSDPNAQVFRVIWVEDKAWYDANDNGGPNSRMTSNVHKNTWDNLTTDGFAINDENNQGLSQLNGTWANSDNEVGTSGCSPADSNKVDDFDIGRRLNRAIEFRKVDLVSGATLPQGLNIDEEEDFFYDPRSSVRHDGSSQMNIQILRLGFDYEAGEDESTEGTTEMGACFETEPKEDVGLDLYYEASNAIPIKLDKDNILNFAPIGSSVHILRRSSGGGLVKAIKFPGINLEVGNVYTKTNDTSEVSARGSIVSLHNVTPQDRTLYKKTFWPTDTIVFSHADGTETQTKILNFVEPVDNTDDDDTTNDLTGYELASGVIDRPRSFTPVEPITIEADPNETNGIFSVSASSFEELNIAVDQLVGSLITGVTQNDVELTVPQGLFIQGFILNDWLEGTTWYHRLDFGGDYLGWVGTPGNVSPVNGISLTSNVKITFIPRTGYYEIDPDVWKYPIKLGWFNCYGFGNGVESDRIRDDFNAPQIDNGVKVSSTVTGYGEEHKGSGMIYSGLYNSTSQMNNLNEFNMADKVTKDLNPAYGSIQALKTRDSDVVVLAEDKALKVIANKDAVYNADGNPQLIATNRVLGTSIPFAGDYGISKNPESLAWDQYRMYFTDKQRGAVLRLSRDGLTPISKVGMKTFFRNQLRKSTTSLGTFDSVSGEYNLTTSPSYQDSSELTIGSAMLERYKPTVSFSEDSKGWVSFKTFVPDTGVSVSGTYLTAKKGKIWRHYAPSFNEDGSCTGMWSQYGCVDRNSWYGDESHYSSITMIFNDQPSIVKSFKTIDYEGSQAKITKSDGESVEWKDGNTETFYDKDYINLTDKLGWWAPEMETDLEKGIIFEFRKKENKWFNQIGGRGWDYETSDAFNNSNLIIDSLDIQGLGISSGTFIDGTVQIPGCYDTTPGDNPDIEGNLNENGDGYLAVNFNPNANYNVPSSCIYYGCSDNRRIGIDILQDHPIYSDPNHEMYNKDFSNNYAGDIYSNITCENDNGQVFNPNNFENGWEDSAGITIGPWAPSCCDYYFCKDPDAINYIGDALSPFVESCTNDVNDSIQTQIDTLGYGQLCDVCEYDCGGGNIPGVGFNATCGCNNPLYIEYWNYTDENGVYTLVQPPLLTSYNGLPYHYNDETQCITEIVYGCTNPNAFNYNEEANVDDGSCVPITYGCIDPTMEITVEGTGEVITVPTANYCPNCNISDGSCIPQYPEGQWTVVNESPDTD